MPLADAGYRVIAIERDPLALHGGEVQLPGDRTGHAMGLIERLTQEGLHDRVQVAYRTGSGVGGDSVGSWAVGQSSAAA
ncbi:hypothetical protein [Streptomyces sp. NPDC057682]|uniref:hypothetical protein n=1 Tax=Streptomyces sp. NPDC057682 TaxID=3346210 RepID=UPI0036893CC8